MIGRCRRLCCHCTAQVAYLTCTTQVSQRRRDFESYVSLRPTPAGSPKLFLKRRVPKNRLQFQEFLESCDAPFTPVARLFVAPETTAEVDPRAVDVHVTRSHSLRNPACALEVSRRHIR